jgi:mevalonate kinase
MIKKQQLLKKYPSKLILFGEYTVLIGGNVMAIPYDKYFASWSYGELFLHKDFVSHIMSVISNYDQLEFKSNEWAEFYENKGFLDSTIPNGYGLGSSGTVVAAFFDTFIEAPKNFIENTALLKKIFGEIESYFHGNSSGVDPLLSFIKKPLLFQKDEISIIDFKLDFSYFELVDSGSKRYMERLVSRFVEKLSDPLFAMKMELLKSHNDLAIEALISNDHEAYSKNIIAISELQFSHLGYLITDDIKLKWEKALNTSGPKYKLCGAGGGGYYMKVNI